MEKGFTSWFQRQKIDCLSTNPNPPGVAFGLQHPLNIPPFGNMISPAGSRPFFTFAASVPEEQLPATGSSHAKQKKFLVFDQSNNRTTMIYHLSNPESNVDRKESTPVGEKPVGTRSLNPIHDDQNYLTSETEMREDTEELNALLDSDDDDEVDYSEDEEERSTGHSPEVDWQDLPEENAREVVSSAGANKRQKLENGGYDVVSLEDTASSGNSGEAEMSSCAGASGNRLPDVESETGLVIGKRIRKEKVRETISVLQDLIPGGRNGKDAMMILDEAINYLRILKVKAIALGLDSL